MFVCVCVCVFTSSPEGFYTGTVRITLVISGVTRNINEVLSFFLPVIPAASLQTQILIQTVHDAGLLQRLRPLSEVLFSLLRSFLAEHS